MKNIRRIFSADLRGLLHNFFALVIAVGLCFLPAFYAWFNIYANWDPYANTGNIRIAVSNQDEGCNDLEQKPVNMGDEIVEQLKQKDNIGWVFTQDEEDALDRVKSGDCYAAVVIGENFSYSMYHALADNIENPKITYYENEKKNAVATKITDTAVSTLQSTINQSFVKVVTQKIFTEANGLSEEISKDDAVDAFVQKLTLVQQSLSNYDQMITTFMEGNDLLTESAAQTNENLSASQDMIASGIESMEDGKKSLRTTEQSFRAFSDNVNQSLAAIDQTLSTIAQEIKDAQLKDQMDVLNGDMQAICKDVTELAGQIDSLEAYLQKVQGDSGSLSNTIAAVERIKALADTLGDSAKDQLDTQPNENMVSVIQQSLKSYAQTVHNMSTMFDKQITPQIQDLLSRMESVLDSTESLLNNLNGTLEGMKDIFDGVDTTLGTVNVSLTQLQDVLRKANTKITGVLDQIRQASDSEQMEIVLNLLSGNPDRYGDFFSQPVRVEEHYAYEIANYGSGVAPFYSVLAIWVGMTILVSILKVHVDKEAFPKARPYEFYFGRYLLFLLLSEIQAMIIVIGDLYILGVQCVEPGALFLVAAVTSLAFSLLIYSLTISFGDIGKALAVVIMVIQIAGSGGTYPIEALPAFFRNVYIFFPFPYAINAMRECIGGMYHQDLTLDLLKLGVFCLASLVIGLWIRIPFMGLNHFIEKRMEDTRMM